MAKLKFTKNELKRQRTDLTRFKRYLPTLQLKKTQLQMEARQIETNLLHKTEQIGELLADLKPWIALLSQDLNLRDYVKVEAIETKSYNIAGVNIPVIKAISVAKADYDLRSTPAWLDDAVELLESLFRFSIEKCNLEKQLKLISEELRVTSQRVNLFEKVKIPEARRNINTIRVFLGNQETIDVARAKMAKRKTVNREAVL